MNRDFSISNLRLAIVLLGGMVVGCSSGTRYSMDEATIEPGYWLEQEGTARADSGDFDRLWSACEHVARDYLFKLDRIDYRAGTLTTLPMVTSQMFEPWRWDASTPFDRDESTLSAVRRTIVFQFERRSNGTWEVEPKVLVERQVMAEKRITSVVMYRSVFTLSRNPAERFTGTRESDVGIYLPQRYWFPVRRDAAFERRLAEAVQKRVGATSSSPSA